MNRTMLVFSFLGVLILGIVIIALIFGQDNAQRVPALENNINLSQTTESKNTNTYPTQPDSKLDVERDNFLPVLALGDPNAPVHIIEYYSLSCGHCGDFHLKTLPQLKENYIDTGKLYFEFREFPLNQPALEATMIARCLSDERGLGLTKLLFENQLEWLRNAPPRAKLQQYAKLAGMSDEAFNSCIANDEMRKAIANRIKFVTGELGINSTPAFIVNGGSRIITGARPFGVFASRIESIIKQQDSQ